MKGTSKNHLKIRLRCSAGIEIALFTPKLEQTSLNTVYFSDFIAHFHQMGAVIPYQAQACFKI